MSDVFAQIAMIEKEAQSIINSARDDAEKTIKKIKDESASEIEAIQKTTEILEKQRNAENLSKINEMRKENENKKERKLQDYRILVEHNFEKAVSLGLQLMEKIK